MNKKIAQNGIVMYQAKSGAIELRADAKKETVWANLNQIAELFDTDKSGISRHIRNIFESGELTQKATVAKIATVQDEGKRKVMREIEVYNLDMIIAIGYRVNSKNATQFRIWATRVLRDFLTKGFVLDRRQIQKNYDLFMKSVADIQTLLPSHVALDPNAILELVKEFAGTWTSIDAYDGDGHLRAGTIGG